MLLCSVRGCNCTDSSTKDVQFYEYPKVKPLFDQWCKVSGLRDEEKTMQNCFEGYICSRHFSDEDFITELKVIDREVSSTRKLKEYAIPSLMLPNENWISNSNIEQNISDDTGMDHHNTDQYNSIQTPEELEELRKENGKLEKKRKALQDNIHRLTMSLEKKEHYLSLLNVALSNYKNTEKVISLQRQKKILSKVLSPAQIKLLGGKKTNWSNDDMAIAYIIRNLGNERCYNYLIKNLNFPLPAISSVRRWTTVKKGCENK